jgi:hypothetical protein
MTTIDYESEHQRVFKRAHDIYVAKSQVRGQLWLHFPPSDKIRELRERVARLEQAYANEANVDIMVEDALDLINYAAFFIKQIEAGQRG